jgi:hypothetical protein
VSKTELALLFDTNPELVCEIVLLRKVAEDADNLMEQVVLTSTGRAAAFKQLSASLAALEANGPVLKIAFEAYRALLEAAVTWLIASNTCGEAEIAAAQRDLVTAIEVLRPEMKGAHAPPSCEARS